MSRGKLNRIGTIIILSIIFTGVFSNQCYAELPEQNEALKWRSWYDSVRGYLNAMSKITRGAKHMAVEADIRLRDAMHREQKKEAEAIVAETIEGLSVVIKDLLNLKPPAELAAYHDKVVESYENKIKSNEAILRGDADASFLYGDMAINSEVDSIDELMRVYIEHGAPNEVIDALYTIISTYKK